MVEPFGCGDGVEAVGLCPPYLTQDLAQVYPAGGLLYQLKSFVVQFHALICPGEPIRLSGTALFS